MFNNFSILKKNTHFFLVELKILVFFSDKLFEKNDIKVPFNISLP